jgi:hypothetical protein
MIRNEQLRRGPERRSGPRRRRDQRHTRLFKPDFNSATEKMAAG